MSAAIAASGFSCAVVGCGNVGGFLAPLLVRLGAASLVLIDPDSFERKNVAGQDILAADVGRQKVDVLAAKLRRIDPRVDVVARCEPVERTPLGFLRTRFLFGCLDSRLARQSVNERAWRLGVTYIDAGIDATLQMVRVDVYVPGRTGCLECSWSPATYEALEVQQPCEGDTGTAPTNAGRGSRLTQKGRIAT